MSNNAPIMEDVKIVNESLLEILTNWSDFVVAHKKDIEDNIHLEYPPGLRSGTRALEHWHTDDYRDEIMKKGAAHEGYPEAGFFYQLKVQQMKWRKNARINTKFQEKFIAAQTKFNQDLMSELGMRRNCLLVAYPEEGFIGWHNNSNAPGYNLIFTFSEKGDGYWENYNGGTEEFERIQDVPGWQCKASYFGHWGDVNNDPASKRNIVWHTAKTFDSWRMTCSYLFDLQSKDWWEDSVQVIKEND